MNRTFEILTISTTNLVYGFGDEKTHFCYKLARLVEKTWPPGTHVFLQWAGLRNDWP